MTLLPFRWLILPYAFLGGILFVLDVLWAHRQASIENKNTGKFLWENEHWIGGPQHAQQRQKTGEWCFLLGMAVFTVRLMLGYSTIPDTWTIQAVLFDLTMILLQTKIIVLSKYSYRQLITAGLLLLPFFAAQIKLPYHMMIICYMMVLAAKDMDLRRTLKVFITVIAVGFVILATLSGLGIIESHQRINGGMAYLTGFGFTNVNLAAMFLVDVAAGVFLLNFHRLKWKWSLLLTGLLIGVLSPILKCKGGVVAVGAAIAIYLIYRLFPRFFKSKIMLGLCMASPLLGCAAWFLIAALYDPSKPIWNMLNSYSAGRVELCSKALHAFPIDLIVSGNHYTQEISTAENIYFETLYKLGLICLVITLVFAVWMVYRLYQRKAWAELIVYMAMLAFGMFELFPYYAYFNMMVWLAAPLLFGLPVERMNLFAQNPDSEQQPVAQN